MMMGPDGISRRALKRLCSSVFDFPISVGGLQKVDTRGSKAIKPHHEAVTEVVQSAPAANIDETTFSRQRSLDWLWVMATTSAVLFRLLPTRSKKAFEELIGPWKGFLTADAYAVYRDWPNGRQSCGAHPLRRAKALAENDDPEIAAFGRRLRAELRRLIRMKRAPPTVGQWMAWRARYRHVIGPQLSHKDDAGKLARHLDREGDTLWAFLEHPELDIEPTNNNGERQIRPGVQWRKRRQGTRNETGVLRVERGLTLHQTCRLRDKSVFHVLVDAVTALFHKTAPNLSWIKSTTPPKGAEPPAQPAATPTA
jgi:transposase